MEQQGGGYSIACAAKNLPYGTRLAPAIQPHRNRSAKLAEAGNAGAEADKGELGAVGSAEVMHGGIMSLPIL